MRVRLTEADGWASRPCRPPVTFGWRVRWLLWGHGTLTLGGPSFRGVGRPGRVDTLRLWPVKGRARREPRPQPRVGSRSASTALLSSHRPRRAELGAPPPPGAPGLSGGGQGLGAQTGPPMQQSTVLAVIRLLFVTQQRHCARSFPSLGFPQAGSLQGPLGPLASSASARQMGQQAALRGRAQRPPLGQARRGFLTCP